MSKEAEEAHEGDMQLLCTHHNLLPLARFPIVMGNNLRKRSFDLISDPPSTYMVSRISTDGKFILVSKDFDFTVGGWVAGPHRLFDKHHIYSKTKRPAKFTMHLMHSMIDEVFKMHDEGKFHGKLDNLFNYGYRLAGLHRVSGDKPVKVSLLHGPKLVSALDADTIQKGIDNDGLLLSCAFDEMFNVSVETNVAYPPYMQRWAKSLSSEKWLGNKWIILNNPCLWPWEKRRNFVEEVWERYDMGDDDVKAKIEKAMRKVSDWRNWKKSGPKNTPMEKILNSRHFDDETAVEFLRFLRLTLHHVKDKKTDDTLAYITPGDKEHVKYFNSQYVEMVVSETYPNFLEDLCIALHEEDVNIRIF